MNMRNFAKDERTAVFVDGFNLYNTAKSLGLDLDYRKMLEYLSEEYDLFRAYYFAHMLQDNEQYSPIKPLLDFLSYNGWMVDVKIAREYTDRKGDRQVKGDNVSVDIAVAMMEAVPHIQHAILFTGDADFIPLLKSVQRNIRVTVVSSTLTTPKSASDDLRRQCDQFMELGEIAKNFLRDPSTRKERTPDDRFLVTA